MQELTYRAWTEIVKDGSRVERSGLIGPRFTHTEAAEQYALDWARQWIDRECGTLGARVHASADTRIPAAFLSGQADATIRRLPNERRDPPDSRSDGEPSDRFTFPEPVYQVG